MITFLYLSMRNIYKEYKGIKYLKQDQSPIQLYDYEYDFLLYLL
jgi:hypothetical protein